MDRDVTATILSETADDRERHARIVRLLAAGVARLLGGGAVNSAVDLSLDVRVTTTTARPGGGDES